MLIAMAGYTPHFCHKPFADSMPRADKKKKFLSHDKTKSDNNLMQSGAGARRQAPTGSVITIK
ncbi:MAG: hypothetical protein ACR2QH_15695 [Geminicoccaceae bacterium]